MPSIARVLAVTVGVALLAGCGPDDDVPQVTATPVAVPSSPASPEPSPTDDPSPPAPTPEPTVEPSPSEVAPEPSPEPSPEPTPAPSPEPDAEEARAREVIAAYGGRLVEDGTMVTVPSAQLFEANQIHVRDEAEPTMEELLIAVAYYADAPVRISVHTDTRDDPTYSQQFSQERSEFVRDWFRDAGVPLERMEALGAGGSEPVADNATQAGREANRRAELVLVGVDAIT